MTDSRLGRPHLKCEGADVTGEREREASGRIDRSNVMGRAPVRCTVMSRIVLYLGRLARASVERDHHSGSRFRGAYLELAVIVGGCLMALGRIAPDLAWLTWIALLPLLLSIRLLHPLRSFLSGLLWGVSFFAVSALVGSSGVPLAWGSLTVLGVAPAFYALSATVVCRRVGFHPIVLAFGWTGVELVLAPLGIHNGLLAAPLADGVLISPLGHILGFVLVAFLVAFVNAIIVSLLERIRLRLPGRDVAIGSAFRELLVSQTCTHAAACPRFSLIPRAPPIA